MKYMSLLLLVPMTSFAYEVDTHESMATSALMKSVLADAGLHVLDDLGLKKSVDDVAQVFPDHKGEPKTINELMRFGARYEDNYEIVGEKRSLNHFFDPVNNRGLTILGSEKNRSPDWALEDSTDNGSQHYSYKDAMAFFNKAMTEPVETTRKQNFGLMFQSLGHVVHHLQDMAQPEHVRNDAHCDKPLLCGIIGQYDPSYYEEYTKEDKIAAPHIVSLMSSNSYPIPVFTTTRQFWTTSDYKGIANFTNRNFFSKASIGDYTNPALKLNPNTVDIVDLLGADGQTLCNALKSQFNGAIPASACYVDFVRTDVIDNNEGEMT